jgi:hypothetical protein
MANIIMNEYCWNDELGELDKVYIALQDTTTKLNVLVKISLMALYKTDALLCDHCAVSKGRYYGFGLPKQKEMAVIPYPWLTSE